MVASSILVGNSAALYPAVKGQGLASKIHQYLSITLDLIFISSVNIPWPEKGMRDADYIHAFQKIVMPIALEFAPELVISASP